MDAIRNLILKCLDDFSFDDDKLISELNCITEEVVAWDEGRHYAYRLRTGAPFRWHRGDVFVSEEHGKTRVRWAIRFESRIPFTGKITAWLLQKVFASALKNLKSQLERTYV